MDLQGVGPYRSHERRASPHRLRAKSSGYSRHRDAYRSIAPVPQPARRAKGVVVSISGRNQLRGLVEEGPVEALLAQVRLRIGDQRLTAIITRDAIDELKHETRRMPALAVFKSTEVMIAREAD